MALIGQIRKNGWILIVSMALALGGFILMDVITNSQRYSSADVNTIGKVNGVEIPRAEFDDYEKLIYTNTQNNPYQVRSQIWDYFVRKAVLEQEAEDLGLGVGKEELIDLQFGNNISTVIAERFKDASGQVNRATLASIKAAIEGGQLTDPTYRAYWAVQEKEVVVQRLEEKIVGLVSKSFYTPKWQAEMAFKDNNSRMDALVVRIPYEKVDDTEVKMTDEDYKNFIAEHKGEYDNDTEKRILEYVRFVVNPTAEDTIACRDVVGNLVEGLRAAENDSTFAVANNGAANDMYGTRDKLPQGIADTLLSLPIGTVIGPVLESGSWLVAKIGDRKVIADSVRARHILIRSDIAGAEQKIDSLKNLVESGQFRFDSLAVANSMDTGSGAKGGDLGWFGEGAMVPEFNNICFYKGKKGVYYKVQTQFGFHLIEITGQQFINNNMGVKAVYLTQRVEPSVETQNTIRTEAENLMQQAKTIEDLAKLAGERNLAIESSGPLDENSFQVGQLTPGDATRAVVRWAFNEDTDEGKCAKELFTFRDPAGGYFDAYYLLPALKSVVPEGKASVASIKSDPQASRAALNAKKAEMLMEQVKGISGLATAAGKFEVPVDTASNISMLQTYLQNGGPEPEVIGSAFGLGKDQVSKPIVGNSGIYFIQPITEPTATPMPADLTMFRKQITSSSISAVAIGMLEEMKKKSKVQDNRAKFF